MSTFRVARKAYSDLITIGQFTQKKWGTARRWDYLKQLDDCFHKIADNPEIGVACDEILSGYRKLSKTSHIIFYRQDHSGVIEIIRVLHKNMDAKANLLYR